MRLLLERYCMDPLLHHMHAKIEQSSDRFKVVNAFAGMKAGNTVQLFDNRKFPLLMAASGKMETRALQEIARLEDTSSCFNCVLPQNRTIALSSWMLKMFTREGARIHEFAVQAPGLAVLLVLALATGRRDSGTHPRLMPGN